MENSLLIITLHILGICGHIGLLLLAFLSLIIIHLIIGLVSELSFKKKYRQFLRENGSTEFFCYTNRSNSEQFVEEHVLPHVDSNVRIIHLVGKKPVSQYDEKYISRMLTCIKQIGFPNIMKIKNGRVVDRSLHHELYRTINQNSDTDKFLAIMREKFDELRAVDPDRR